MLTKNFNSVVVTFDKEKKMFCIKIGDKNVLMLPSEFEELIDALKTIYNIIKKRYLLVK